MAMEIQAWFQSWLEQGAPARAVQDRGKKRPSSEAGVEKVDREQRQRLFTECRTQASQKLGEALTSAAKERQEEKGGLLNEIKKKMAYSFFQSCTPEQQDAICPLAQTLRSGKLDSLSARFLSECALQGRAASGTSAVSEPVCTPEPSHCSQPAQAAGPLPPSTTSGVSEPASASAPTQPSHGLQRGAETEDSTQPLTSTEAEPAAASPQNAPGMFAHHRDRRREINRVSKAIADQMLQHATTSSDAATLMQSVQKRLNRALAGTEGPSSPVCETCSKLGNAIGSYRTTLGQAQGDVRPLDKALVRSGLNRTELGKLNVKISQQAWRAAQAEEAGGVWKDPRGCKNPITPKP